MAVTSSCELRREGFPQVGRARRHTGESMNRPLCRPGRHRERSVAIQSASTILRDIEAD